MAQQLVFLDTEFTDLDPGAVLISIGLVSEDGRTFAAGGDIERKTP